MADKEFNIGDRVRVTEDWFVEEFRGAVGCISEPPKEITLNPGTYWVEFDLQILPDNSGTYSEAAEVDSEFLELA